MQKEISNQSILVSQYSPPYKLHKYRDPIESYAPVMIVEKLGWPQHLYGKCDTDGLFRNHWSR